MCQWSCNNVSLVFSRVLHLDSAPEGLAFSSQQGDLTIALHNHLHTITNITCKPTRLVPSLAVCMDMKICVPSDFTEALHKLVVSIQFSEVEEEEEEGGQEFTIDLATLPVEDRQRLELVDDTIQQ